MQEVRYDGSQVLTKDVQTEQIMEALANPRNKQVRVYVPGSRVERWESGVRRVYEAQEDGSLAPLAGDALR